MKRGEFFHSHFSAYYYSYKRLVILHFLRKPDFWLEFKHMFLCCCLVCSLICHWKPVSTDALPRISFPHSWNVASIYEVQLLDWQENSCLLRRLNFIILWPLYRFFSLFKISIKKIYSTVIPDIRNLYWKRKGLYLLIAVLLVLFKYLMEKL